MFERAAGLDPSSPTALYNAACCEALLHQTEAAVHTLQEAVGRGYRNVQHLMADADLAGLHELSSFQELVARMVGQEETASAPAAPPAGTEPLASTDDAIAEPAGGPSEPLTAPEAAARSDLVEAVATLDGSPVEAPCGDPEPTPVAEIAEVTPTTLPAAPSHRFAAQLDQLARMGFLLTERNIAALEMAQGRVGDAVVLLLEEE